MFDDEFGEATWSVMGEHFMGQHRNLERYLFLYWKPVQAATMVCSCVTRLDYRGIDIGM